MYPASVQYQILIGFLTNKFLDRKSLRDFNPWRRFRYLRSMCDDFIIFRYPVRWVFMGQRGRNSDEHQHQ